MTDRELLEMAAMAAGLGFVRSRLNEYDDVIVDNHEELYPEYEMAPSIGWNPIKNDLDALRLAVNLRMTVQLSVDHVTVWKGIGMPLYEGFKHDDIPGRFEATRRAIVRAAAEIGKAAAQGLSKEAMD